MRTRLFLCLGLVLPVGCGAPAIVDAAHAIATLRGCEAAELTVADTGDSYAVAGCGAAAAYRCEDGSCTEAEGDLQAASAERVHAALSGIEPEVLGCAGGDPVTVQVHFVEGQPRGFDAEPPVDGDTRLCMGRILLAQVALESGGADLLVAHRFGQAAPNTAAEPPPVGSGGEAAPPEEASSPEDVPVAADLEASEPAPDATVDAPAE